LQILYDSIQAVGGDVSGMTRAEVRTFEDQAFVGRAARPGRLLGD
jgi:hypothetical protein